MSNYFITLFASAPVPIENEESPPAMMVHESDSEDTDGYDSDVERIKTR